VLQPDFAPRSDEVANQWPIVIAVAIAANDDNRCSSRAELVEDPFRADIAQVPDFIRLCGKTDDLRWEFVMRVCEDEDFHIKPKHQSAGTRD
jgi:hypothetical protein